MIADRAAVGVLATAIRRGDATPRAAMLGRKLENKARSPSNFGDVEAAPEWLGRAAADRLALGRRAALAAIAPAIAKSVDGGWLGGLAKIAGDTALDWAAALDVPPTSTMPRFAAHDLDAVAASALRAGVPPSLRDHAAPRGRAFEVPAGALAAALAS